MFFQMFLSEHALRNIPLKELEDWAIKHPLERVYRDPSPRRGSPCLIWVKRKPRTAAVESQAQTRVTARQESLAPDHYGELTGRR